MSRDASISFDWADGHHTFRLPIGQLRELQEKTGVGPLRLLQRLMDGSWMVDDAREVLRLGLIGGGFKPDEALRLVRRYVDERPLLEAQPTAVVVLAAALRGTDQERRLLRIRSRDGVLSARGRCDEPVAVLRLPRWLECGPRRRADQSDERRGF